MNVSQQHVNINEPSRSLSSGAVFGHTVTCGDRQDSVVATSAIGAQDGDAERLRLHSGAAHTLLLHGGSLQGVYGLTATFTLTDNGTMSFCRIYILSYGCVWFLTSQ